MARTKKSEPAQADIVDAANAAAVAGAVPAPEATSKKAIVTQPFAGCRDGELHPVDFAEGDEIEGDLASAMVAAGFADPIED